MATIVDVTDSKYPKSFADQKIQPLEGLSLAPTFRSRSLPTRALYFEHEANRAIQQADWKAVSRHPNDWELYNVKTDRSELHNLAAKEPKRLSALTNLYEKWSARVQVPTPDLVAQRLPQPQPQR